VPINAKLRRVRTITVAVEKK